jgi:heat shock protein HslJ
MLVPRPFLAIVITAALFLFACGSNSSNSSSNTTPNNSTPTISGAWEFKAVPTNPGSDAPTMELVETNLQQNAAQISATGQQQIDLVSVFPGGVYNLGFGCQAQATATLSGTLSGNSLKVQLSLSDGTKVSATATVNTDGTISGTYTGGCPSDSQGTFTGKNAASPNGIYNGNLPNELGVEYPVSLTFTETSNYGLSISGTYAGQSVALSGFVVGSGMSASGTFQGQAISFIGYLPGDGTLQVWNQATGAYLGALQKQ